MGMELFIIIAIIIGELIVGSASMKPSQFLHLDVNTNLEFTPRDQVAILLTTNALSVCHMKLNVNPA